MAEKKNHECDCEMEHKHTCDCQHDDHDCDCHHDHDCDCGCETEDDLVILQDEDGNDVFYHYVYNMEHDGKEYVFLQAVDCDEDEDGIEIFSLQTTEENGEYFDLLDPVDDDLYDVLYNKLIEVAQQEDDCDCDCDSDCDCDCEDK